MLGFDASLSSMSSLVRTRLDSYSAWFEVQLGSCIREYETSLARFPLGTKFLGSKFLGPRCSARLGGFKPGFDSGLSSISAWIRFRLGFDASLDSMSSLVRTRLDSYSAWFEVQLGSKSSLVRSPAWFEVQLGSKSSLVRAYEVRGTA